MTKWVKAEGYEGEERRMGNGSHKIIWTVMIAACGVVFLGYTGWMTSLYASVQSLNITTTKQAERIAALEAVMQQVGPRLERIERKLDDVLVKVR